MAKWKKVLVSGSQIEVAGITASAIPSSGGFADRVVVFDTDGAFKSVLQSNIQGMQYSFFKNRNKQKVLSLLTDVSFLDVMPASAQIL